MTLSRLLAMSSVALLAACTILINGQPVEPSVPHVEDTSSCRGVVLAQPAAPVVPDSRMEDDEYVKAVLAEKIKEQKRYIDGLLSGTICPPSR